MVQKLKTIVFGKRKDVLDPHVFHHLSLIAFFAWIGLGADGLSSSCYGPEEAFLSLGPHSHLALWLTVMVVGTVFLLSASYSQIDRKSTRLNSSHQIISYAVFCLTNKLSL